MTLLEKINALSANGGRYFTPKRLSCVLKEMAMSQPKGGGGGSVVDKKVVRVTYTELKALRDEAKLKPGTWYRLTDYKCTTKQENSRAVEHPFDLLILAVANNTLFEECRACLHEGDEYFAKSHLEAWQLWYCIDNDTDRFGWADAENGRGVIYRMIDEHRNDVPYDFKNIQFKRWKGTNDNFDDLNDTYCIADPDSLASGMQVEDQEDFVWLYTFSLHNNSMEATDMDKDTEIFDETVYIANNRVLSDEGLPEECRDNKFLPRYGERSEDGNIQYQGNIQFLNNNTFLLGCFEQEDHYYSDYAYGIYGNECGADCYNNSIGSYFQNNSIGSNFNNNSIGNYFQNNSIGSNFNNNSIGSYFQNNSIGSDCYNNSIGSSFYTNSIGSSFYRNSIVSDFSGNSIGSRFYNNSIGSGFGGNSIGSGFDGNSIGSNVKNSQIGQGVQYVNVTGGNDSSPVQYTHICSGAAGVNSNNKLTITFTPNVKYTQFAAIKSDGSLEVWSR